MRSLSPRHTPSRLIPIYSRAAHHTRARTHTQAVNDVGASLSLAEDAAPASVDGGEAPTYAASEGGVKEAPLAANAYSSSGGGYQS